VGRASKDQVEDELKQVSAIIAAQPGGMSRKVVGQVYSRHSGKKIADRTLQRRLEELIIRGTIAPQGDGPGTVYKPAPAEVSERASEYTRLSAAATKIRLVLSQPISKREPVGYDRDWLFAYRPGVTWYLPRKARAHLQERGVTPDGSRPAGTFARDILSRLLIDLSWASSRLEGNTYTRLDTQNLLEFGQRAEGKDAQETQMILNHKAAIELLVSDSEMVGFNRATLLTIHAALSENLLGDPADEGRLRERPVSITGTSYTPTAIPQVIRECFDHILECAGRIPDPFEQAFFVMVHIPYLQPFADVNKRTSRLAANIPLIRHNLCPLSFVDVPEDAYTEGTLGVYEQKRVELLRDVFMLAYDRSSAQYRVVREAMGQPDPIRLRYRTELAVAVAATVRAGEPPSEEHLRTRGLSIGVPADDSHAFALVALKVLLGLHEGSAGRYGLQPSEYNSWKARYSQRPAVEKGR
jgi:fido (protein-threonine AMPylation protein)